MKKIVWFIFFFLLIHTFSYSFGFIGQQNDLQYVQLKCIHNLDELDFLQLKSNGFSHFECIAPKLYFAHFNGSKTALAKFSNNKISTISQQDISYKCPLKLLHHEMPSWALIENGKLKISIRWQMGIDINKTKATFEEKFNIHFTPEKKISPLHSQAWVSANTIALLAQQAEVRYVSAALPNDVALNYLSQGMMSCGYATFNLNAGGRNLKGDSLTVGIGDNADVQLHADLVDRVINFSNGYVINHGYHTTGSLAGAGNMQPKYKGILPKATILSNLFSDILYHTPLYKATYNMVLTNNSYGAVVGDCDYAGTYDDLAKSTDELVLNEPEVNHVFAAGNNGTLVCPNEGVGFRTVLGGYQAAKNIITVANIRYDDRKNVGSSQGPLKSDNRLKPDVAALGNAVLSTVPGDGYNSDWGTSMASPQVAGVSGLLVQRYKQLHSNSLPKSDLVKALILNGAYDIGRKGPDVTFGYGRVSSERSLQMLEKENYKIDSLAQGDSLIYNITITNSNMLSKFLLYYHDLPANPYCNKCLMNDLDLYVIDPAGIVHLPYVINTQDSTTIIQPAYQSRDSINNTEQVEINYGLAGSYKIVVKGTQVLNGKQRFNLVYDTITPKLVLRSPIGSEKLISGSNEILFWDKYDTANVTYDLFYSNTNGATWLSIASNVPDSVHFYVWNAPVADSNGFKIKVTASNGLEAISETFACMPLAVLSVSPVANQCPTFARVTWNPIAGVTDYLLLQKEGAYMKVVDSTTNAFYIYKNLDPNTKYYFAVQPRKGKLLGQQATAKSYIPNAGSCILVNYNNDLRIDTLLFPRVGRKNTSTEYSNNEQIKIIYSNQGNSACTNYSLSYSINGGSIVTQVITTSLAAHSKDTLLIPYNLSAANDYPLQIAITNLQASDPNSYNDTLKSIIRHLPNDAIDLTNSFSDGFETSIDSSVFSINGNGILGLTRWDFNASSVQGRLRTKVLPNFSHTGNYAVTLDNNLNTNTLNTDTLIGTFNLINYQLDTNDVRLDFFFKHHNVDNFDVDNAVYLRGNDTSTWVKCYDLLQNQSVNSGEYKQVKSLKLSRVLKLANQQLSASTQLKFTHTGKYKCVDYLAANGYTFDDIKLYKVRNDIELVSIEPLANRTCGLNNNMPIIIQVQNTSNLDVSNVKAAYSLDGQNYITETIPLIKADSILKFTFNTKANLSGLGNHKLSVYVNYSQDSYRENDSLLNVSIFNYPLVSQFPYLENFETNNGYFHSEGVNATWQHGVPTNTLKINRAASGLNCWKTNLNGAYKTYEKSYLFTPCFDISSMPNPNLSFSLAYQIENCGTSLCDGAHIDYSFDGLVWKRLDFDTSLTQKSWYSDTFFAVWNGTQANWKSYSFKLPKDSFGNAIQLRFAMQSDGGLEQEGIAIDDIHVYDLQQEIYTDSNNSSTIVSTIQDNDLHEFVDKNQLFSAIQLLGNDQLANCKVNLFINNDSLRFPNSNYFLDRNITVKPDSKNTNDSVNVRMYFPQTDVDRVLADTTCLTCAKPRDAYDFGITKFSSIVESVENGNVTDNTPGIMTHEPDVTIVPYNNGYYAEMKVKNFSEFWLSYAPKSNSLLTMKLKNFEAINQENKRALLTWQTETESNNHHFEIERAVGNVNFQNSNFVKIGDVLSKGDNPLNDYSFTDNTISNFSEVYYYRLKWLNNGGEFGYTEARPVVFGNSMTWVLYPNPSTNPFIQFQVKDGQSIQFNVTDVSGRKVFNRSIIGTGFVDKININIDGLANGIYILKMVSDGREEQVTWLKR